MVSLTHLLIIAVGVLIAFTTYLIIIEKDSAPPNKVWVVVKQQLCLPVNSGEFSNWIYEKREEFPDHKIPESYNLMAEFLKTKGVIVYESKTVFKREFQQFCEACGCSTGYFDYYLLSKNDAWKLREYAYQ